MNAHGTPRIAFDRLAKGLPPGPIFQEEVIGIASHDQCSSPNPHPYWPQFHYSEQMACSESARIPHPESLRGGYSGGPILTETPEGTVVLGVYVLGVSQKGRMDRKYYNFSVSGFVLINTELLNIMMEF